MKKKQRPSGDEALPGRVVNGRELRAQARLAGHVRGRGDCQEISWWTGRLCPVGQRLSEPPSRPQPSAAILPGPDGLGLGRARDPLVIALGGRTFKVSTRAPGVRQFYGSLERHFGLVVAVDGREPLLVVRLGDFLRLCRSGGPSESPRPKTPQQLSGGPR